MLKLFITRDGKEIEVREINSQETSIGREPSNDIFLDDQEVKRKQAIIKKIGTNYVLADLSGDQSTLVNGKPIITCELRNGQEIGIGPFKIKVEVKLFESILNELVGQLENAPEDILSSRRASKKGSQPIHKRSEKTREFTLDEKERQRSEIFLWMIIGFLVIFLLFIGLYLLI